MSGKPKVLRFDRLRNEFLVQHDRVTRWLPAEMFADIIEEASAPVADA